MGQMSNGDIIGTLTDTILHVCGGIYLSEMQVSVLRLESWGFVLRVKATSGKSLRLLPLTFALIGKNGDYLQNVATSGTIDGLETKLIELGLSTKDGMK